MQRLLAGHGHVSHRCRSWLECERSIGRLKLVGPSPKNPVTRSVKIFLSYPSEERETAYRLQLAIAANGHDVFFDREDLPAGHEYDQTIARWINASDLFVFLITPDGVKAGRYTLTELGLAEDKWRHPSGRVLPVMLRDTPIAAVPIYARAVNILVPRGDIVAETAHEIQRLARDLSLTRRVGQRVRSRAGLMALGATVVVGGIAWIASASPGLFGDREPKASDSAAADTAALTPLPDDVRHRARAVAATADGGFVLATTAPSQLIRFAPDGKRVGQPIALAGEPMSAFRARTQILITTRASDGFMVFDASDLHVVDTVSLDPARVRQPPSVSALPRPSGDLRSIAIGRGDVWAVTGERDGEPSVLRYRAGERQWDIASWVTKPEGLGPDARGLRLRLVNEDIWGVTAETTPSSLYRFVFPMRVEEFGGHELRMVSCAHDLAESAEGHLLFLSCDNELQEVRLDDRQLKLVRATATLPSESAPGNWTDELLVPSDSSVLVALNTEVNQPRNTPGHARIAEVSFAGSARALLDERGAVVVSMAVTPRSVVAVLRRANGAFDAVSVPRRR
jgi:hypothetical protein